MGVFVSIYLTLGIIVAGLMAYAISKLVEHRGQHVEVDQAANRLELAVSRLPGGVVASLILIGLFWPLIPAIMFVQRKGRR